MTRRRPGDPRARRWRRIEPDAGDAVPSARRRIDGQQDRTKRRRRSSTSTTSAGHHVAGAHGRRVDTTLPATRERCWPSTPTPASGGTRPRSTARTSGRRRRARPDRGPRSRHRARPDPAARLIPVVTDPAATRVRIYEVGPRDGLQNEASPIPTTTKLRFIELLAAAGLSEIEATASSHRGRSPSSPTPTSCSRRSRATRRPLPGPRPEHARHGPGRGGRAPTRSRCSPPRPTPSRNATSG